DRTDLMTWEEFTNFDPNYLEEREKAARRKLADAKRMAHLMSGPYKNRMVGLESNNLLNESPDAAVSQSGNYTASWRDDGCITLIINGKGDVAYSDYPAMSHNKMADIIFINHYTERNDLDDEAEYDFEDKLNSIKYL